MEKQMAAAANRSHVVNGRPTSLADLGYSDIGLDVSFYYPPNNGMDVSDCSVMCLIRNEMGGRCFSSIGLLCQLSGPLAQPGVG